MPKLASELPGRATSSSSATTSEPKVEVTLDFFPKASPTKGSGDTTAAPGGAQSTPHETGALTDNGIWTPPPEKPGTDFNSLVLAGKWDEVKKRLDRSEVKDTPVAPWGMPVPTPDSTRVLDMTDAEYEAYRAEAQAQYEARNTIIVDGKPIVLEVRPGVVIWTPAGRSGGASGTPTFEEGMAPSEAARYNKYWKAHAPEGSKPFDLRRRYTEDGQVKQVTTYDEFGDRHRQFDIIDPRRGEHQHNYEYGPTLPRPKGSRSDHQPINE